MSSRVTSDNSFDMVKQYDCFIRFFKHKKTYYMEYDDDENPQITVSGFQKSKFRIHEYQPRNGVNSKYTSYLVIEFPENDDADVISGDQQEETHHKHRILAANKKGLMMEKLHHLPSPKNIYKRFFEDDVQNFSDGEIEDDSCSLKFLFVTFNYVSDFIEGREDVPMVIQPCFEKNQREEYKLLHGCHDEICLNRFCDDDEDDGDWCIKSLRGPRVNMMKRFFNSLEYLGYIFQFHE